jgi:8-oxo-dGTP diphosphatase
MDATCKINRGSGAGGFYCRVTWENVRCLAKMSPAEEKLIRGKTSKSMKTNCPLLSVDIVVFTPLRDVTVLIERRNPPLGYALPGGMVDRGERLWEAAKRELREEVGLTGYGYNFIGFWDDPKRDKRDHIISAGFTCSADMLPIKGMDDAKTAMWVNIERIFRGEFKLVIDHFEILQKACISMGLGKYLNTWISEGKL